MKGKKVNQEYKVKAMPTVGQEPKRSALHGGLSNTKTPFKSYSKKGK